MIRSGGATIAAVIGIFVAASAGSAAPRAADSALPADPGERLRHAWIAHRLQGELEPASAAYRAVAEDAAASPDLRARARLGLALLERDRGEIARARDELARALEIAGAAPRWRRTARLLRAELEGRPDSDAAASPDLLRELEGRVASLNQDLERVRTTVTEREAELERKDRMLRRLEEHEREAVAASGTADRRIELEQSRAHRWLEELVKDDQQKQRLERALIGSHLIRGREAFREGRIAEAHNEMKKILSLDPLHREALDLASRCRALLAAAAGVESFPTPDPAARSETPPDLVEELTIDAMRAYLGEAERHQEAGRTLEAIRSATKVLEEHSWSPAPLPEEFVREIVGGAERLLEECLGATATAADSAQARELRDRQLELIGNLRERFARLMATELALAEADESAARLTGGESGDGSRRLVQEFEATMAAAERALAAKRPAEAARHYHDLLVLLEWVPELDPEGTIAPELARQLAALGGGKTGVGTAPAPAVTPPREP